MRKMVVRIDDVGFSDVCNIGSFKTVEEGIATAVDVMLDCPGTEDALRRLRDLPYVSIGWHGHMWGSPVLPVSEVPSLVEHGGRFDGRFRTDLFAEDINYDEALRELRAQLDRCIQILGRVPDTCGDTQGTSPFRRAIAKVREEYGMTYGFMTKIDKRSKEFAKEGDVRTENEIAKVPNERFQNSKIVMLDPGPAYQDLFTDSITELEENYDPVKYYTEDRAGILQLPEDVIVAQAWHPGYVDYFVYKDGERTRRDRARKFISGRVQDVEALTSRRMKDWIIENKIELVNFTDAIFGTHTYQNYLRLIGSELYMGDKA